MANKYEPPQMVVFNAEHLENLKRAFDNARAICSNFVENFKRVAFYISSQYRAHVWAKQTHPEWLKILNRTKKRRIKEKYQKRILREYLKQKEAET